MQREEAWFHDWDDTVSDWFLKVVLHFVIGFHFWSLFTSYYHSLPTHAYT